MSAHDFSHIGLKRPVEHNKQPNRIIYFGTDGCVGHYPLGINFHLTRKDDKNCTTQQGVGTIYTTSVRQAKR